MDALIRNLLAAFKVGIDELEWMSPETKLQAQAKLAKFRLEDRVSRSVARLLGARGRSPAITSATSCASVSSRTTTSWSRLGKPVERWRWGFTPQTVNASYSATNNEITFPAGILQPPFFDLDADDAINYGAIGAVIGHEISHGFDDQGRKSDGDGNLRDWWTAEDAKRFDERAAKLGAQFESYTPLPGHEDQRPPDDGREHRRLERHRGRLSRLQDLAERQAGAGRSAASPAISASSSATRRSGASSRATRRCAISCSPTRTRPGYYRAFVPLTNIDAFYKAFNLKPGDKLYRAPEDRVKIW